MKERRDSIKMEQAKELALYWNMQDERTTTTILKTAVTSGGTGEAEGRGGGDKNQRLGRNSEGN